MKQAYWIAGGCICVAGIAVTIVLIINKRKKASVEIRRIDALQWKAAAEFMVVANAFIGLYEPIHMIKEGTLKFGYSVFADWDTRISNLDNSPSLVKYWNDTYDGANKWDESGYKKKAEELIMFLQKASVSRSRETEVTVSREILKYYSSKDGTHIEHGATAIVNTPYWSIKDTVLEKGQISEIKDRL